VLFSYSLLDAPARLRRVAVLGPLAVAPEHQRTGTLVYHQAFWDLDCVGLRD
jgi:predicted N-acetyltransferase YhbS